MSASSAPKSRRSTAALARAANLAKAREARAAKAASAHPSSVPSLSVSAPSQAPSALPTDTTTTTPAARSTRKGASSRPQVQVQSRNDNVDWFLGRLSGPDLQEWIDLESSAIRALPTGVEKQDRENRLSRALELLDEAIMRDRLLAIRTFPPPKQPEQQVPPPQPAQPRHGVLPSASTTTSLVAPSKLKDLLDKQGSSEPLAVFAARCRAAVATIDAPISLLLNQVHALLNDQCKSVMSGMLAAGRVPPSLDALFDDLRLRIPSTAKDQVLEQRPGQSVAAFGDECQRHLLETYGYVAQATRDDLGAPLFLAGLLDDEVREHVALRVEEYRFDTQGRKAPLSRLVEWAVAAERAPIRARRAGPSSKPVRSLKTEVGAPFQISRPAQSQPQHPRQPPPAPTQRETLPRPATAAPPSDPRSQSQAPPRPGTAAPPPSRPRWPERIDSLKFFRQPRCCWRCGQSGHSFRDSACPEMSDEVRAQLN